MRLRLDYALLGLASVSMMTLPVTEASAFTLGTSSLEQQFVSSHVEKVWWDRWGRWHPNGYGYGWGPGYWGPGHCWRGYYGHVHCN